MGDKQQPKLKHNKVKKILLVGLSILVISYIIIRFIPYGGFEHSSMFVKEQGEAPLVIAHGGAKHLYPENTVMAFKESFNMGVDVLEMDLCLTKDNILVTHHDLTIDATTNTTGAVRDFTYDQICGLNFGYNFVDLQGTTPYRNETSPDVLKTLVPMTVEEMFATFGDDTLYIMEIKDQGADGLAAGEELNRLIGEHSLEENVCVASFNNDVMEHFKDIKDEKVNISTDFGSAAQLIVANFFGFGRFINYEHAGLQLPTSLNIIPLDNTIISDMAHDNNMFLHYWTINDRQEMQELILLGCDGIITDRPDIMFEVLEDLGY